MPKSLFVKGEYMKFTREQKDAIEKSGNNILVAAAAGSGKTAVLVERIIQKILTQNIDIDKLLVVTFTNAAASEMRERILDAIYSKLNEEPENLNLQKQINLLSKSSICTIHSFCLDVIRNNFFEIGLSSNFRIGNDQEILLLKQEILDELFEKKYEEDDEEFLKLVETYTGYRGDEDLKNIVLKLYEFSQSSAFPEDWINEKVEMFNPDKKEFIDFGKSVWGKILLKDIEEEIIDGKNTLKALINKMNRYTELYKFSSVILEDLNVVERLENALKISWDKAFEEAELFKFERWPVDKNVTMPLKDEARDIRKRVNEKISKVLNKILLYNSEDAYNDVFAMYSILKGLKNVVLEFSKLFADKKNESNIIDFNDIEHFALKLLIKKDENGNYVKTEIAEKYANKFREVAVDEYQDSNQVQELILSSVSNGKNMFMVGDIKQSIYKFRKACPKLFAEKYNNYSLEGNDKGLKIQLFKNFRSRENILNITNTVFKQIMSKELGDIDYTEEEYLNLGASYEKTSLGNGEIHIIDLNEENDEDDEIIEEAKLIEKEEYESRFVAKKINEMINSEVEVFDKKCGMRKIKYKDIVILLRSTKNAEIYEKELLRNNIPVYSDSQSEFLETFEIKIIMNLLKVLDNPLNDIGLVSVLRSPLFGFSDNEIVEIRLLNRDCKFYYTLLQAQEEIENEDLKSKIIAFIETINKWKKESEYKALSELLWKIYIETGFYNYVALMINGHLRQANLKILFERVKDYEKTSFKGLFNFIRFMEKVKSGNSDFSQAKIIGENEDVVRIMSIHKSKGLEFPVVFLCNSAKKINLQDLNGDILLHDDLGIGPEYINYERKIEYSTAAKNAIKIKLKEENISEEMRILYVALTRAREKLIVVAARGKEEKEIEKKKELLEVYSNNNKIDPILLKKYITYLDWFELVKMNEELKLNGTLTDFSIVIHKCSELKNTEVIEDVRNELEMSLYENYDEILDSFNWKYEKEFESNLPIKSTVSIIKTIKNDNSVDFSSLIKNEIGLENIVPDFLHEEKEMSSVEKGTLMHLTLQKMDLKKNYDYEEIYDFVEYLKSKNFITDKEAKYININQIQKFIKSNLGLKIKDALEIYKEKPFCIKIKAKEILENATDEEILVQGIIDLYFIDKDNKIVLVDYKTDFVRNPIELIEKYKVQLDLYKRALEESLGKKVDEVYIYSLVLGSEIKV